MQDQSGAIKVFIDRFIANDIEAGTLCHATFIPSYVSAIAILQNKINIVRVRAWTDFTIVLAWLTAEQKLFKIFVTNRVAKIRSHLPQCEWAHVNMTENPADPAFQELLPDTLVSCSLFLHGPTFLYYSVRSPTRTTS